jgi:hypothetical protein
LISASDLGVCSIGALPEEPADGFVFGFRYALGPPACPGATSTVDLVAREYATRAHRDAAAVAASGEAVVLGRWVITLEGDDAAARTALADRLVDLGGIGA